MKSYSHWNISCLFMGWTFNFFSLCAFQMFWKFCVIKFEQLHIFSYTHVYLFYMTYSNFTNLCPYCNAISKSLGWRPYFGTNSMWSIYNRKVWSHLSQQSRKGNIFKLIYGLCSYDTRKIWLVWWNSWRMCISSKDQSTWWWGNFQRWRSC